MRARLRTAAMVVGAAGALAAAAGGARANLIYHYGYNEGTGTESANLGQVANAPQAMYTGLGSSVATNLFSADGGGVTGLPGDHALDLSGATASSTSHRGSIANRTAFNNLSRYTVSFWAKSSANPFYATGAHQFTRLIDTGSLEIYYENAGGADGNTNVGLLPGLQSGNDKFNRLSTEWTFYAVTFDGTDTDGNNVNLYRGTRTTAATLIGTYTTTVAGTGAPAEPLIVGNRQNGTAAQDRAYDGFMDDLRIDDAVVADIEGIRLAGLTPVPEPSTAAVAMAAAGLAVAGRRRRRRRRRA